MALHDNKTRKKTKVLKPFTYALAGIRHGILTERHMKFHLFATIVVIAFGLALSVSLTEWLFLIIAIGGVISLEMVNSAIERTVDLVTDEYKVLAKQAKDLAAGAVLVYAIVAAIIGLTIFLPKLLALIF